MKVPLNWLKEFLPTKLTAEQIADLLTVMGLEVEGIELEPPVLEISLTPNLVHCASIWGIARELSASTQEPLRYPAFSVVESEEGSIEKEIAVSVENTSGCPRYACRVITGVTVAPSPPWLQERLEQCGMRSVNNIVDITNLVMLELGHPLHAFDLDTLAEKKIAIRNARKGERLTTLDGKEHYPTEEMLMICDGSGPIAVAGIMGSKHTEVTDSTTSILLESAYFEPTQVRRTSKHLGIHTESSYRFERGADPNNVLEALERATAWISALAGGSVRAGKIDIFAKPFTPLRVSCRIPRVNQVLGTHLSGTEMRSLLQRLGFEVLMPKKEVIEVTVPTYRHDIHEEIDLIEEIARLYGFNQIHTREKALFRTGTLPHSAAYLLEKEIRSHLLREGLQELITCDLISPEEADLVAPDCMPSRALIKLLNPRSLQQSVLRPSLLPGLLSVVKRNEDHGTHSIAGFEIGRLHFKTKERYLEPTVASLILVGQREESHWENKKNEVDFFDLKGIIENLLKSIKSKPVTFQTTHYENFHPGRQAAIKAGDLEIGIMGELHPTTLKKKDLTSPVYFAELNLSALNSLRQEVLKMRPLPSFPSSTRDWTATLPESTAIGTLFDKIASLNSKQLESVMLLDVYRSETLGSERKNVTLRFIYRDPNKTLSIEEIESEHKKIVDKLIELRI